MRDRRVIDPPGWIWFVIPALIAAPVVAGILIAGPMLGFVVAAVMALAIVAASWRDGARRPGGAGWRRAAAGRFLVALAVAVAGIVVAAVASGSLRIIGWGVLAVALVWTLSLVFLEVGYSEDRARAAAPSTPDESSTRRPAESQGARRRQTRRRAGVAGRR